MLTLRRCALVCGLLAANIASAQESEWRLHVQPSVAELPGDGDATAVLTISARDADGELVDREGTVALRVNAGRLAAAEAPMRGGIAEITLTAPILDDEAKTFQRGIELTMAVMQALQRLSADQATGPEGQRRMLEAATQAARDAPNAAAMRSAPGEDPVIRVVAELAGVRGKAEIAVRKLAGDQPAGLRPGFYEGRDVTGAGRWTLEVAAGGPGLTGELVAEGERLSFRSRNETKGGFLIVYLYDERELQSLAKGGIDFLGWPTAVKPLPGDMLYMLAPPVYMRRTGDLRAPDSGGAPPAPELPAEQVSLVARRNMLPGDGRSETELLLRYRDAKGRAVPGARLEASLERGGLGGVLVAADSRTNAQGQARFRYRAPEFFTDDIGRLGGSKREVVKVGYRDHNGDAATVRAEIGILCCTKAQLKVEKPGFAVLERELIVASPRGLVRGRLEAEVRSPWLGLPSRVPVADAQLALAGSALDRIADHLKVKSDDKGNFEIELPMKNWPYFWQSTVDDLELLAFSAEHEHQRKALIEPLYRFPDEGFRQRVREAVQQTELGMCREGEVRARGLAQKMQLAGGTMALLWMTDKLVADTGGEVVGHGWSLIGIVVSWANERWKLTKSIDDALAQSNKGFEQLLGIRDAGGAGSLKLVIYRKLRDIFGTYGLSGGRNPTLVIMDQANSYLWGLLQAILGDLAGKLAEATNFPGNPVPELITLELQRSFRTAAQPEIERLLAADPETVSAAFDRVQPRLLSGGADLRDHYLSIASWRLAAEDAMAVKNLVQDIGFAVVLATSFATAGPAGVASALQAWEKFKKVSETIDTVYAVGGFAGEMWNLVQLEAECLEVFRIVNQAVAARAPPAAQAAGLVPLSAVAWAGDGELSVPPRLGDVDYAAADGRVPWTALVELARRDLEWAGWEASQGGELWRAGAAEPKSMRRLISSQQRLDDARIELGLLALATGDGSFDEPALQRWNELAREAAKAGSELDRASSALAHRIAALPSLDEAPQAAGVGRLLAVAASGVAGLAVLAGLGLLLLRRVARRPAHGPPPAAGAQAAAAGPRLLLPGGGEVQLAGGELTLGAAPDSSVLLPWAGVAPHHARLQRSAEGRWWVELAAPGLTLEVNGSAGPSFWLAHGSRIRLGTAELLFLEA